MRTSGLILLQQFIRKRQTIFVTCAAILHTPGGEIDLINQSARVNAV